MKRALDLAVEAGPGGDDLERMWCPPVILSTFSYSEWVYDVEMVN